MSKRKLKFKTETQKLLDLVIHSLYSHKEIFLRELISNASDAIDKHRFESLTNKQLSMEKAEYSIKLTADKENKTLTVSDNGIGMSEEELIDNLGTIARSGTCRFLESLESGKKDAPDFIGQFGVGFYASFMVADKVEVLSRRAGEQTTNRWISDGTHEFTLESAEKEGRGTDVILHINEEASSYLESYELRSIVKKYSDFIEYPVKMDVEKTVPVEGEEGKTGKKIEEETLNSCKAIWMRSPSDIKDEEYNEFYSHLSHDYQPPYARVHYKAEGTTEFNALLFFPDHMPVDLMFRDSRLKGVQLYVRRIFIMDEAEAMLPRYLRFVRGVVDSADLPLNVSREILQQERTLTRIKSNLVKRILDTLKDRLSKDREGYTKFFKELGAILKEGLALDFENKKKLSELLLFESTGTRAGECTSLPEYFSRMPATQQEIYYITGENRAELEDSPYLEALKEKGYEVLFLIDSIDEIITQHLTEYEEKKLKSVTKGDIDLSEDKEKSKKEREEKEKDFEGLEEFIQKELEEHVKEVRISSRLLSSPACLVADEYGMSASMERLMRAMQQNVPVTKRIMEINPDHPLIKKVKELAEGEKKDDASTLVKLLYSQSVIAEGGKIANPGEFVGKLSKLMEEYAKTL